MNRSNSGKSLTALGCIRTEPQRFRNGMKLDEHTRNRTHTPPTCPNSKSCFHTTQNNDWHMQLKLPWSHSQNNYRTYRGFILQASIGLLSCKKANFSTIRRLRYRCRGWTPPGTWYSESTKQISVIHYYQLIFALADFCQKPFARNSHLSTLITLRTLTAPRQTKLA